MIRIEQLQKAFSGQPVLNGIDLHLEEGRVYGIVGENGAGKTTLFRCIAGLESYEGRIYADVAPLKNHLGFLPTDPYMLSYMTGREYLRLLCRAREREEGDLDARNIFGLPLDRYAETYSTGMRKKLALMGVLLQGNRCFILDEPFNGVDIQSNILITEIIHELRRMGRTVIISSHIFSTLCDTCDEIHLLREGRLVRRVMHDAFHELEAEMKAVTIDGQLARLDIP